MAVRRLLAVWAGLVLLAGCSGDSETPAAPSATLGTEPPRTTTTDSYAIPAVIDAAYVNRVLAGLDAAFGEVVRIVTATKSITPDAIDRLRALYLNEELLQLWIDSLQGDIRTGFRNFKPEPGNRKTTVTELLTSRPSCVYAKVEIDPSAVAVTFDPRLTTQWIAVRPTGGITNINRTGWGYIYEGFDRDLTAPDIDPCAAI